MFGKIFTRSHGGWMLAETICCVAIALTVSACALETSGSLAAISKKSFDKRKLALDYCSIVHEAAANIDNSSSIKRGQWISSVSAAQTRRGMKSAAIFIASGEDGAPAEWKQWEIKGRE